MNILYKLDSKGAVRQWRAWTVEHLDGSATEYTESGLEGGTLSGIPITLTKGKNIGRKNETTPIQQADLNTLSKYNKKIRAGYVEDISEYTQKGVMAAQEWSTSRHRMSPIALHQPKLDGIRCKPERNGGFRLISKSNKEFKPFLYETPWALSLAEKLTEGEEVDGEMYIHGVELQDIASLVMSYKRGQEELLDLSIDTEDGLLVKLSPKNMRDLVHTNDFPVDDYEITSEGILYPGMSTGDLSVVGTNDLEFWLFDVPDETSTAEERNLNVARWDFPEDKIIPVVASEFNIEDIISVNEEHVHNGFEGTMVRLPAGLYAFGKRSAVLLKFKLFHDSEWEITGHTIDREGNPVFTFISDAGVQFSSRPTGTRAWRKKVLHDIESLVGTSATIRYQMLFQESLVPQFSRVIAIRDYE